MDNTEIKPIVKRPVMVDSLPQPSNSGNHEADLDGNGQLSKKEEIIYEKKSSNRRAMAWVALLAMVFTGVGIMFFVPESRLSKINAMLDLYWISLGGIVGAYVGISTWMSRR